MTLTRRAALLAAGAVALGVAPTAARLLRGSVSDEDETPLRELAAAKGLFYGCATANFELRDADFTDAFLRECGMLVPEYELKRDLTEPEQGHLDFSATDTLASFAEQHGVLLRGHPLVWYAANPPWLEAAVLAAKDERIFTDYIAAAAGRYAGRMHSWDVVNEALEPKDGLADGMRNSLWLTRFGARYIDMAFQAAREADADAILVYNEFGIEQDGPACDARRHCTLKLLEGMLARGVSVDALGLQAHLMAFGRSIPKETARFLDEVRGMGLKILITELDVDDADGPLDIASRDRAVADAARRFLDIALDNPATIGLLTWGLTDRYLKPEGIREGLLRGTPRRLPLDEEMRPVSMRAAIAAALRGARTRVAVSADQ